MAASCHSGAGRGEDGDGSATVYFGPATPQGVKDGNWIQTVPAKGRSTLFRLCSPLGPFFGKTWHPSGTEPTRSPEDQP